MLLIYLGNLSMGGGGAAVAVTAYPDPFGATSTVVTTDPDPLGATSKLMGS